MPKKPIDVDADLGTLCWIAAQIIQDEGDLQNWHLDSYIPSMVLMMATTTGLIPSPTEPKDHIGYWMSHHFVSPKDRDAFIERIAGTLDDIRTQILGDDDDDDAGVVEDKLHVPKWIQPTPREIIDKFRKDRGWSFQKVADAARKLSENYQMDLDDKEISAKTIQRMRKPGHNARPGIARTLARLMEQDSWIDLQWQEQNVT